MLVCQKVFLFLAFDFEIELEEQFEIDVPG